MINHNDMEKFEVTILGCGSASPTAIRHPAAQIINLRNKISMIDCGEGTQMQMRTYKISFQKLRNIFISHMHGDHCFGLIGLISSLGLLGRTASLHVYGPADFEDILQRQLKAFCDNMEYEVIFHPLQTDTYKLVYEDRSMEVYTLPLQHRVPCCGFIFREKPTLPHIRREMIDYYGIPNNYINHIKNGADWILPDGSIIRNDVLTLPPAPTRSYAYCSDTAYKPDIQPYLMDTDVLYHEATFSTEHTEIAKQTYHSTAAQAASIALNSHVGKLIIGHYSARYTDTAPLLEEAQKIFPATIAAQEGMTIQI